MNKCNKCDERGYISKHENGSYSGRSCPCGWAIAQQEKMFEDVILEQLIAYGMARRAQKEAQTKIGV